jgi:hydrogenase nickel incorporation protein HypA/HybF
MHEDSLVRSLLKQVGEIVADRGGGLVVEVCIEAGPLSGIEPSLFMEVFQRLRDEYCAGGAELRIETVGLSCRCRNCHVDYQLEELGFVCPHCGGAAIEVVAGDAVILKSITLLPADAVEIPS